MVKIVMLKHDVREGNINRMGVLTGRTKTLAGKPQSQVYMFTHSNINTRYMWVFNNAILLLAEVEIDSNSPLLSHSNNVINNFMTLPDYLDELCKEQIKS